MDKVLNFIDGYKTYIVAIGIGVAATLHSLQILSDETYTTVNNTLLALMGLALRHAISKGK